jgi:ATP-dependent Lon protease
MKESARAALTWARSHASELRIPEERLRDHEVHVHVPAGAVQKEGPSAGIAMAVSLISALGEHPVRSDVAMTGEITLTGRVLPIGGLKEKVLGAYRAGIRQIILPASNEGDLEDLPEQVREQVTFSLVHSLDEVVPEVFRGVGCEDGQLVFRDGGPENEASREEARATAG